MNEEWEDEYIYKIGILVFFLVVLVGVILFFNWHSIEKLLNPPQIPIKGPDRDGDGFSDKFEEQFGNQYNHLNPDVYNGRYAIIIDRHNASHVDSISKYRFLTGAGYKPENIKVVADFTRDRVKQAIDDVASVAGENDLVMINLAADGDAVGFCKFNYGNEQIGYKEFSSWLNEINSTQIITVDTCKAGAAIPFLKNGKHPRIIYAGMDSEQNGGGDPFAENFYQSQGMAIVNKVLNGSLKITDYNEDGYVSVGEGGKYASLETAKLTDEKGLPIRPQMSDDGGIADYLFIAEKPAVLELKDTYTFY